MRNQDRPIERKFLTTLYDSNKSEFIYVRGRRRIGKSWLLKQYVKDHPKNAFYFSGSADSTIHDAMKSFADAWDKFVGTENLSQLRSDFLSWDKIFSTITEFAKASNMPLTLVFDEIQWIAKDGAGFCGKLKTHWIDWQQLSTIKVIVCGSSARFFNTKTGGEEKILRGLQTRATLYVEQFSLRQVAQGILSSWLPHEIATTYMMFGGVPYYLSVIDEAKGFIHAINAAVFTADSIFIEEVEQILNLEFNAAGKKGAKKIIEAVGQDGMELGALSVKTKIPLTTVSDVVHKLVEFNILYEKQPGVENYTQASKSTRAGTRFFLKDFYLNFYAQILRKEKSKIKANHNGQLLFTRLCLKNTDYYIENFSGKAFELLIRMVLETRGHQGDGNEAIFAKLQLADDFTIGTYWSKKTQIDLVIESPDRLTRIVECKWGKENVAWIAEVVGKDYPMLETHRRLNALVISENPTLAFEKKAKDAGVVLVSLKDLL